MSPQQASPFNDAAVLQPERALRLGAGAAAAAPLWAGFVALASAGAAWWWMTAWTRRPTLPSVLPTALAPRPVGNVVPLRPETAAVEVVAPIETPAPAETSAPAETPAPTEPRVETVGVDAVETVAPAEAVEDRPADTPETSADAVSAAEDTVADRAKAAPPRRKPTPKR